MTILGYSGLPFDYTNPTKEMVSIEDIIHSLPRLNRFVGHTSRPYSVGEHTLYCSVMADFLGYSHREQLLVLIHDFTEAYVGDCPAPLKNLIPDFGLIEEKVEFAICDYIGIKPPTPEEFIKVKRIDKTMLINEMRALTKHNWREYLAEDIAVDMISPLFSLTHSWTEEEIKQHLTHYYVYLTNSLQKQGEIHV